MKCICGGNMHFNGANYQCAECYAVVDNKSQLNELKQRKQENDTLIENSKRNMSPEKRKWEEFMKKHPKGSFFGYGGGPRSS